MIVPRAARFTIQVPLQYRVLGDNVWLTGTTANISASGVLFVADRVLEFDTPVQMVLVLPVEVAATSAGRVMCHGRIVRVASAATPDEPPAMAATIANYRLIRGNQHSDS